jgi:hypothetical protein
MEKPNYNGDGTLGDFEKILEKYSNNIVDEESDVENSQIENDDNENDKSDETYENETDYYLIDSTNRNKNKLNSILNRVRENHEAVAKMNLKKNNGGKSKSNNTVLSDVDSNESMATINTSKLSQTDVNKIYTELNDIHQRLFVRS